MKTLNMGIFVVMIVVMAGLSHAAESGLRSTIRSRMETLPWTRTCPKEGPAKLDEICTYANEGKCPCEGDQKTTWCGSKTPGNPTDWFSDFVCQKLFKHGTACSYDAQCGYYRSDKDNVYDCDVTTQKCEGRWVCRKKTAFEFVCQQPLAFDPV